MIKKNTYLFAVSLAFIVIGCNHPEKKTAQQTNNMKGEISISGAFALYPMTVRWAEEFNKEYPDVRIDISAGGAGKGMADALSGMVDLGMFSRGITKAELEKGAWYIAVTKDAVLPTINASNPFLNTIRKRGMNREDFRSIFLETGIQTWGSVLNEHNNNARINTYTRSDACGAAQMWGEYLGKNQESLCGIGVFGDPGMASAVKSDLFGIGYNNVIYVYDIQSRKKYPGLEVVPVDLNNNGVIDGDEEFFNTLDEVMNAIKTGKYPSPPARDLYFVAKGKPGNHLVITFLEWILTNGQDFVDEAGYVQLSGGKIKAELEKIK